MESGIPSITLTFTRHHQVANQCAMSPWRDNYNEEALAVLGT